MVYSAQQSKTDNKHAPIASLRPVSIKKNYLNKGDCFSTHILVANKNRSAEYYGYILTGKLKLVRDRYGGTGKLKMVTDCYGGVYLYNLPVPYCEWYGLRASSE